MQEVRSFVGRGARILIERGVAATGDAIDEESLIYYHAEFLRHYEKNIGMNSESFQGWPIFSTGVLPKVIKAGVCTNKYEGLSAQSPRRTGPQPNILAPLSDPTPLKSPNLIPRPIWKR